MRWRRTLPSIWRLLVPALVALLAHSSSRAQLQQAEVDRLFSSLQTVYRSIDAADWQGCLRLLDETAALAHHGWTHTSVTWFAARMRCEARALQSRGESVTAETVALLAAPGLEHWARVPPGVDRRTSARIQLLQGKWWLMRDLGLGKEAALEERQIVQALIEADKAGADTTAREDMDRWAHSLYGFHPLLPQIQEYLSWISTRYGQGHRAALILRRAVSFAYRSADRSVEALAVMDDAARLAALHYPGDKDLQIAIAGERAPCLAANGLWLEARDEFVVLRDGMLQKQPVPHGNLMRMNYHLAGIANRLGDHEQAEAFANAADWHAQQSALPNDRVEVAVAHLQRAEARLLRGVPGAADEVRRELERITAHDGGTGAPAFSLAKLGYRDGDRELLEWSKDFLDRHAHLRLQPLQPARALVEITTAWSVAEQDPVRARGLLERAAIRGLSDRDPGVSVQSAFSIARELTATQPEAAVWWFKRGANALQALRQRGRAAQDEGMHRATLADHEADLRTFIALLIDEGRYTEARDALRVLREEELHDFTRRSRQRAAAARSSALAFNSDERRFEAQLMPLADRMRAEQPLADARARPAPLEQRGMGWLDDPASETLLERAQADLRSLLASLSQQAQQAAGDAPCGRTLADVRNHRCGPDRVGQPFSPRERPAPGTAHLQYFVRDQHVDILVTTARGLYRHSTPIARSELNRRVHAWRAALLNPAADPMGGAREFHALMIQPVQAQLRGVRHLQVSLDGALRYLPLAALHDGKHYLVQQFSLQMDDGIEASPDELAAAAAGPNRDTTPRQLRLAAFGRTTPDKDHSALPGVEAELKALAALGQATGTPRSSDLVLQDAAFTAQSLHDTLAATPRVVHIASHFHLAAAEEESSYLLLGDGQRLPLARLAQMPWDRVWLVLLSACDSAVSDAARQGREFNGLADVLRQAGVGNVLASLWPIADASTASFMREFYRPMNAAPETVSRVARQRTGAAGPLPEPSWLSQAQRRWLARYSGGAQAHPYHWAAFAWWSSGAKQGPDRGRGR